MPVSLDDLKTILQMQQAQNQANQTKLLDAFARMFSLQSSSACQSDKHESIINSISEFQYDPEANVIFSSWFHRCEDIFRVECSHLDDAAKVRLLLRRLGTQEYNKYVNFILPQNPRDVSFKDTVQILSDIFDERSSLFNTRYKCFQITKSPEDDYLTYAGKVNRQCERFKINEITADQFKCLIFICGLKNEEDADVRTRMLVRIEQEPNMTLQMVTTECQRLLNLKHDTAMVQQKGKPSGSDSINALRSIKSSKQNCTSMKKPANPPSPCWFCGAWHFAKFCPFKNHKCRKCHRIGHKEGHCSLNKRKTKHRSENSKQQSNSQIKTTFATFKVGFKNRRKFVNLLVNGKLIRLQLDTASDVTLISKNTWHKLGCPSIRPTEHVARNASGDIVKLTGEVLCNVQLMGSKFTDVCYLTNRHDLDLLGLDWIAHVDTLNKLLDEVCSQNVSYDSIQIPNDISKSNASDESSSLDINELNASDETCSYDLSESNNSNVMCSHHVKSNTADSLPSHKISKSNTSDKVCASETSESHVLLSNVMSTSKSSASSQLSSVSYINHLRQILPVTAARIAEHTRRDPILRRLSTFIQRGWPPRITSHELKQYYQRRQSLSIVNDCIMVADRVVVPYNLRSLVLKQLHTAHPGTGRMKAIARSYVYWPNIDEHIEDFVRACRKCAEVSKCPRKAELHSWPSPEEPWSRIHVDFAGPFQGTYFLVCVDAYSKWPEIFPINQITSQQTIMKLRQLFSRFGVPDVLVTDNGTQFISSIFSDFCKRFGVKHVRSPPYHPQSNGQAERFVDTFKRALLKAKGEGKIEEILDDFLLVYRTTPNPSAPNQMSPAEIMFGRKVRTALDAMKPQQRDIGKRNRKMENQFDRHHGAKRRIFQKNQKVYVRDFRYSPPQWTSGRILKRQGNVMYVVEVEGQKWTRHVNHILENAGTSQKTEKLDSMWRIILDSFDIKCSATQKTTQPEQSPIRKASRKRRRPDILQVDPKRRTYVSEGRYQ
ncbi:unnamed protein product [Schistosoma haematobium]|nr:unnamed protein product [Schistosoma haematobium]